MKNNKVRQIIIDRLTNYLGNQNWNQHETIALVRLLAQVDKINKILTGDDISKKQELLAKIVPGL